MVGIVQQNRFSQPPTGRGVGISQSIANRGLASLQMDEARMGLQTSRDQAALSSLAAGAIQLKQIQGPEKKREFLINRIGQLRKAGTPTGDSEEALQMIDQGRFDELEQATDQAIQIGQRMSGRGASPRAFAPQTIRKVIGENPDGSEKTGLFNVSQVFDPATREMKTVETPLAGELVTSTGETIGQQRLGEVETAGLTKAAQQGAIAETAADIEGEKVLGRVKAEAKTAPLVAKTKSKIETALSLAREEASAKGETMTELKRARAAMPGLQDVIGQLKELAPIATSTLGGRVFDSVIKESGFGSTKGANARAKFTALINNQVLPLLKPTFGAAFTVGEGDSLRATMGDVDASPAQKLEQLEAFIDQKVRDIETKELELGQAQEPQPAGGVQDGQTATNPQTGEKIIFSGGQWVPA